MAKEMKIVGFNFSKILVERQPATGEVTIKSDINIKSIEKAELKILKEDLVSVAFVFNLNYENLGLLSLEGAIAIATDNKFASELVNGWKDKKIDNDIRMALFNIIMQKCTLKALQLEEEMNLPFHIQLPRLTLGNQENQDMSSSSSSDSGKNKVKDISSNVGAKAKALDDDDVYSNEKPGKSDYIK